MLVTMVASLHVKAGLRLPVPVIVGRRASPSRDADVTGLVAFADEHLLQPALTV
jgi:hypothetical protein